MDLSGLSAANLAIENSYQNATSANVEKLRETANKTKTAATDDELMGACKEFEAYLLEQVFKEMQKTVDVFSKDKNDQSTDKLVSFFKDNTITELCKNATENQGLGLAQMMYENLKVQYAANIPPQET